MKTFLQHDPRDCGIACLRSVLHAQGNLSSVDSLRQIAATTTSGTSLLGLRSAAQRLGFEAKALTAELGDIASLELPCILHWDSSHYVLLWRVHKGRALIGDPALGKNIWWKLEDVNKHWAGNYFGCVQVQILFVVILRVNAVGLGYWCILGSFAARVKYCSRLLWEH